jgi:hypothetical protein
LISSLGQIIDHCQESIVAFAGSNQDQYGNLTSATVDIGSGPPVPLTPNGQRVYLNDGTFPNSVFTWPALSDPNARAVVSIRPPLYELINPTVYPDLAKELDDFLKGAPSGPPSLVALWHEASGDNESGNATNCGTNKNEVCRGPGGAYSDYFAGLDSGFPGQHGAHGLLTAAQSFVQNRVQALNQAQPGIANVKVGAVEVVSKANPTDLANTISEWMAGGLDFYAADVYDSKDALADPTTLLDAFQQVCKDLNGGTVPTIGITETNSRWPGRRPFWFTTVWSWLKTNGHTSDSSCFLTYWNDQGLESGAWIPDDWATIDSLYGIFAESSP